MYILNDENSMNEEDKFAVSSSRLKSVMDGVSKILEEEGRFAYRTLPRFLWLMGLKFNKTTGKKIPFPSDDDKYVGIFPKPR